MNYISNISFAYKEGCLSYCVCLHRICMSVSQYFVWFLIFAKGPLCGPLPAMNLIMVWTSRALFIQSFLPQAWITFFSALFASSLYGSRTDSNTKQPVNKFHCTVHFYSVTCHPITLGVYWIYVYLFVCLSNAVLFIHYLQ